MSLQCPDRRCYTHVKRCIYVCVLFYFLFLALEQIRRSHTFYSCAGADLHLPCAITLGIACQLPVPPMAVWAWHRPSPPRQTRISGATAQSHTHIIHDSSDGTSFCAGCDSFSSSRVCCCSASTSVQEECLPAAGTSSRLAQFARCAKSGLPAINKRGASLRCWAA